MPGTKKSKKKPLAMAVAISAHGTLVSRRLYTRKEIKKAREGKDKYYGKEVPFILVYPSLAISDYSYFPE